MKASKANIIRTAFLLVLTVSVLFATTAVCYPTLKKEYSAEQKKSGKKEKQEDVVSVARAIEAVPVSILTPEFSKAAIFTFTQLVLEENQECLTYERNTGFSEKYFETLFTHFISPNAP